jgi:hypothetical protein
MLNPPGFYFNFKWIYNPALPLDLPLNNFIV